MRAAEKALHVAAGDLGEVRPALVRDDDAMVTDGAKQPAGECTGARARLQHSGAGEHVGEAQDVRRVLGVDDRGAAFHRQRVVGEQRAQRHVGSTARRAHHGPLGLPKQVVVRERAAMGVKQLARLEEDQMLPPFRVGQLDLIACDEGSTPRLRHAGKVNGVPAQPFGIVLAAASRRFSDAGEDPVQIAGREHAEDPAGGFDEQVLSCRGAPYRFQQVGAGQVG